MKLKIVVIDLEIPARVKRIALRVAIPAAALVGFGAIAYASVPLVFTAHSPLTAADLNADFNSIDSRVGVLEDGGAPYAAQAGHAAGADTATTAAGAAPGTFAVPNDVTVGGNVTVSGTLSVGLHASTSCTHDAGVGISDCACAAGEIAIGGGGYGGGAYLDESRNPAPYPALGNIWRIGCRNAAGTRVQCVDANAICARLAP
jgi:hypothetical protein